MSSSTDAGARGSTVETELGQFKGGVDLFLRHLQFTDRQIASPGRFRRDAHPTAVEARRNATLLKFVGTDNSTRAHNSCKDTIQSVMVAATHYRFNFTRIVHGLAYR